MTPWRRSARAIPSSAPSGPIASWPPRPWTWTSTKPGRDERAVAASRVVELDLGDPAVANDDAPGVDAIVEDEPTGDDDLAAGSRRSAHALPPAGTAAASG